MTIKRTRKTRPKAAYEGQVPVPGTLASRLAPYFVGVESTKPKPKPRS